MSNITRLSILDVTTAATLATILTSEETHPADILDAALRGSLPLFIPLIIICGVVGNVIVIYTSPRLCKSSPHHYLAAVSISDSVFLLGLLASALDKMSIVPYYRQPSWYCQTSVLLTNTAACVSSWCVTAMAVERWAVITQKRAFVNNDSAMAVRRAIAIILFLVPLPLLFNTHVFVMNEIVFWAPTIAYCSVNAMYTELSMYFNFADTVLVFAIPFFMVVALNFGVFFYVRNAKTLSRTITTNEDKMQLRKNTSREQMARQRNHLAAILFVVPVIHIAMNAPSYILRAVHFANRISGTHSGEWINVLTIAALMLHYISFAVNLFTYSAASMQFRIASRKMLHKFLQRSCPLVLLRKLHLEESPLRYNTSASRAYSPVHSTLLPRSPRNSNCPNGVTFQAGLRATARSHSMSCNGSRIVQFVDRSSAESHRSTFPLEPNYVEVEVDTQRTTSTKEFNVVCTRLSHLEESVVLLERDDV